MGIYGPAGVTIEEGPCDFQIIQQEEGKADIALSGTYAKRDIPAGVKVQVVARIVLEDTGEPVTAWQEAALREEVEASGRWSVILGNVPAGGLYRIETMLSSAEFAMDGVITRGDMIHHLGVGDIYLIAGQSNASGRGKDPVSDPPELGVHMYRNSGSWTLAAHPLNDTTRSAYPAHLEYHNPSHSPYLSFAKHLKRELGYPIGLVQSALGGMPLRFWDTDENGELYRNMIQIARDAAGGHIRGVLWYQGCTDALEGRSHDYLERFLTMVERTRAELGIPRLPFLTVQLNRCTRSSDPELDRHWGLIREAQRQAAIAADGVYAVPASDCMLYDLIHNSAAANMMLGERMARLALSELYGCGRSGLAPDIERAAWLDEVTIELSFRHIRNQLYLFELPADALPFTIEDAAGVNPIAHWSTAGSKAVLTLSRPARGTTVVHGVWQMNPPGPSPADWGRQPILSFYGVPAEQ